MDPEELACMHVTVLRVHVASRDADACEMRCKAMVGIWLASQRRSRLSVHHAEGPPFPDLMASIAFLHLIAKQISTATQMARMTMTMIGKMMKPVNSTEQRLMTRTTKYAP